MSCVLEDWHVEPSDQEHEGQFDKEYVDGFLGDLKMFFIGGLVNPRTQMGQRCQYIASTSYLYVFSQVSHGPEHSSSLSSGSCLKSRIIADVGFQLGLNTKEINLVQCVCKDVLRVFWMLCWNPLVTIIVQGCADQAPTK